MLELSADLNNLPAFLNEVRSCARNMNFDSTSVLQIELAVEEVIVNIINYAYSDGEGSVCLTCEEQKNKLVLKIIDSGRPFDINLAPAPDTTASVADRKIGGLGLFFVKKMMDNVLYERKNGKNILTLTKKLKP
jgi:anti-sigma regulatory factor (Ser/Thr protein kinase)